MIINIFKENVKRYPNNICIECKDKKLTYLEIDNITDKMALNLKHLGIKSGSVVCVKMKRSEKLLIVMLSIFKLNATYLPIDVHIPFERTKYIVEASGAAILISGCDQSVDIDGSVNINEIMPAEDEMMKEHDFLYNSSKKSDVAYILFTSGTTGVPKGAIVYHGGMLNHLNAKIKLLNMDQHTIIAQTASSCFDISIWQYLAALCVGGKVIVYTDDYVINVRKFMKNIELDSITILEVVPSYFDMILRFMELSPSEQLLGKLEYILLTGEEIRVNLIQKFKRLGLRSTLINAYGPTEASDDITHYIIDLNQEYESIPIGYPIDGAELYIVNEDGRLCEKGELGEVWVTGVCVGGGYINNDEETSKHFIINPFSNDDTKLRVYKTGDLGRVCENDCLEFHGRIDSQIKYNGYRIELGEIEEVLAGYKEIYQAAAIYVKEANSIITFYSAESEYNPKDINLYLKNKLSGYMMPKEIFFMKNFEVTSNGKVDRKKLKEYYMNIKEER